MLKIMKTSPQGWWRQHGTLGELYPFDAAGWDRVSSDIPNGTDPCIPKLRFTASTALPP